MSRFLAPIHSWLFNKIKLHEELEEMLVKSYKNRFGEEIDNIVETAKVKFGEPLENKPIEELIDTSNIHGWLQNRIEIAETRQSSIITEIINTYGRDAAELTLSVYEKHGSECGKDAAGKFDVETAPQIYQALNSYILDGMPCDNVNNITNKSDDKLVWKNSTCLHRQYWEAAEADVEFSYELRYTWIKAFIENANSSFRFEESSENADGTKTFIHEIIRK